MRNQKGITLVALVITIIVLLILAGVSISLVLGQNGVLTQASNAVIKNEAATAKQEVQMASADAIAAYYEAWTKDSNVAKSSYYTTTVFANNCTGAKQVYITSPGDSNTDIKVKYVSESNSPYYFDITVDTGAITEITGNSITSDYEGLTTTCKAAN